MSVRRIGVLLTILLMLSISVGYAEVLPSGGGSGAIFTTTPDGSIVNENVHYEGRHYVYLDGGPKQNAPAKAAGLDEGFYVFQVTDPSGKILLSRDPARCRIVHVSAEGVIDQLMAPTDNSVEDPDENTVVFYTGATTDNWSDGNGKNAYPDEPCHVPGPDPDSAPGTDAPIPDIWGVGRHDTNPDVDHNDVGAFVAQLMPYGLTPNPGGVYKAWLTPIQAYLDVKGADLNEVPSQLPKGKQKPHECVDFCAEADDGFVPSHRYTKTDNFKVTEQFPAEIKVRKFHDLNGNGIWDEGEPEIGVDELIEAGGWLYHWTYPLDGGTKTEDFYTPGIHVAGIPGIYSAEENWYDGWTQTASWLDGEYDLEPQKLVEVEVYGLPGETHEIWFGNAMPGRIYGKKVIDYNANGEIDPEDVCDPTDTVNHGGCAGVTVILSGYSNLDGEIDPVSVETNMDGEFSFDDIWPGTYNVTIEDPAGFFCSYPDPCEYTGIVITSGEEFNLDAELAGNASFADWQPGSKSGMKFEDIDGQGVKDATDPGLGDWQIDLLMKEDDNWVLVASTTTSPAPDGAYAFSGLTPGVEYAVCEVLQDGWTQSYPNENLPDGATLIDCSQFSNAVTYGPDGYAFTLVSGQVEVGNDFGNFKEELTVSKTAVTSFTREHFWDITKRVDTDNGYTEEELPKIWLWIDGSGDETATWTVDVTYEGFEDYDHNVSGVITIENTGTVAAVITDVDDVLGGTSIAVDCGVVFPYTLAVDETLTCTYDEDVDVKVEGLNIVTVTTQRDNKFDASADIIWGDPTTEINKTVNIEDISDLFGTVALGSVTAPNGATFTYEKAFTWADYGADLCGDYIYDNEATIVETGQSDDATLKVNVQCYIYESAWAEGSGAGVTAESFCDNGFSNWGWSNQIGPGTYTGWTLWAGAGQCDTSKGMDVGTVDVVYDGDGYVTVEYHVDSPYILMETHVYVDVGMFPLNAGSPTTAPGQYYNASPFGGELVYVIAHAVVGIPDPDFGP